MRAASTAKLVRLSPVADLEPHQRRMVLALRKEATDPTLRLTYCRLGLALLAAFVVGLLCGCEDTPLRGAGMCTKGEFHGRPCHHDSECGDGRCALHTWEKGE